MNLRYIFSDNRFTYRMMSFGDVHYIIYIYSNKSNCIMLQQQQAKIIQFINTLSGAANMGLKYHYKVFLEV